jgi:hypothetical protein
MDMDMQASELMHARGADKAEKRSGERILEESEY